MTMTADEMVRYLKKNGFKHERTNGSHYFFRNPETGRTTTVPYHKGDLKPGLVRAILKQAGLL